MAPVLPYLDLEVEADRLADLEPCEWDDDPPPAPAAALPRPILWEVAEGLAA